VFYIKVATRGGATARKGSPRQALDYITDGHDTRRDPGYSDGELAYIARMGEGWKTDLEGGRVPLTGFGLLAGESDEAKMRAEFEASCLPTDRCATVGYKSITFTLPKEVSLFAGGHREKAREAMNAAVGAALERAFPGMAYTAVGAIHRAAGDPLARPPALVRVSARLCGRPASAGAGLVGPQHDHDDHAVFAPRSGAGCGADSRAQKPVRRGKYVAKTVARIRKLNQGV
jgi:hypothetical protein